MGVGLVVFDLEKTLTKIPTWSRFLYFVNRRFPHRIVALFVMKLWVEFSCTIKILDRQRARTRMMVVGLAGKDADTIERAADSFAVWLMQKGMWDSAIAAVRREAQTDRDLVLATDTYGPVARALAERLGFDYVLATELLYKNNRVSRKFRNRLCYGDEKLRRVIELESELKTTIEVVYADHIADLPLLRLAKERNAVNPKGRMRRIARENFMNILEFTGQTGRVN